MSIYKEKKRKTWHGVVTGIVDMEDLEGKEYQGDLFIEYGKNKRKICTEGLYCTTTSETIKQAKYGSHVTFERELCGMDGYHAVNVKIKKS